MMTKNIRQTVTIKAKPGEVYEALMDPAKHSAFSGGEAVISREVGGKFTTFDGYADGVNLELIPSRKIAQSWRASDWPAGHYSTVSFMLNPEEGGTRITFTQTGVPEDQYADIAKGWRDYYWEPLKEYLEKKK